MKKGGIERKRGRSYWGKVPTATGCITIMSMMLVVLPVFAADMKASLAQMPIYAESTDKGILVDSVKAIARASGEDIEIQVVPFNRSMHEAINGKVDFHMPLIKAKNIDEASLDYAHSTETIFHVNFVLYTNKNKPIDKNKLKDYEIETDLAHVQYFDFPINGSNELINSLKKLQAGRIDGFIFADIATDPIIKEEGMEDLHRELYEVFDVKIVLPKGEKGKATDVFLAETIQKMRNDGTFDKIMSSLDQPYNDWQL